MSVDQLAVSKRHRPRRPSHMCTTMYYTHCGQQHAYATSQQARRTSKPGQAGVTTRAMFKYSATRPQTKLNVVDDFGGASVGHFSP